MKEKTKQRLNKFIRKTDTCWLWTGFLTKRGYGHCCAEGRQWLAHRAIYTIHKGPIPEGLTLDHLCYNPACVNPEHLEPVTLLENIYRSLPHRIKRTHCKHGHEYTAENTHYRQNKGYEERVCRECNRIKRRREIYAKKTRNI